MNFYNIMIVILSTENMTFTMKSIEYFPYMLNFYKRLMNARLETDVL